MRKKKRHDKSEPFDPIMPADTKVAIASSIMFATMTIRRRSRVRTCSDEAFGMSGCLAPQSSELGQVVDREAVPR